MQIIKPEIANQLKDNSKAKHGLAYEFDCYVTTIDNWIKKNNEGIVTNLTTPSAMKLIAEELGYKKSELLIDSSELTETE